MLRPNLDYEQEDTVVEKRAKLFKHEDCSNDNKAIEIKKKDLEKMKNTGLEEFKSISVIKRDQRDWYIKAFRKSHYNGTSKNEDQDEFIETDLGDGTICLSSRNGY